jgi:hypothetical protein
MGCAGDIVSDSAEENGIFFLFFVAFTRLVFAMPPPLEKCLQARLRPAQYKGMHIMCALICVDGLQIHDMANHVIFVRDAIAAMHVARHSGDLNGFAARISFDQRDGLWRKSALIEQLSGSQAGLQPDGDFRLHVSEFFLNELVGG